MPDVRLTGSGAFVIQIMPPHSEDVYGTVKRILVEETTCAKPGCAIDHGSFPSGTYRICAEKGANGKLILKPFVKAYQITKTPKHKGLRGLTDNLDRWYHINCLEEIVAKFAQEPNTSGQSSHNCPALKHSRVVLMFAVSSTAETSKPPIHLATFIEIIKPEIRGKKEKTKRYNLPQYQTYALDKWVGVLRYQQVLPGKVSEDASTREPVKAANDITPSAVGKDTQEVKASDPKENTEEVNNHSPENDPKEKTTSAASDPTMTLGKCLYACNRAFKLRKKLDRSQRISSIPEALADEEKLCQLNLSEVMKLADSWAKFVADEEHQEILEHEKGKPVELLRKGYRGGFIPC